MVNFFDFTLDKKGVCILEDQLPKALIFGAGSTGRGILNAVSKKYQVIGFIDNNPKIVGEEFKSICVFGPEAINPEDGYVIIIGSHPGLHVIKKQLVDMGVNHENIDDSFVAMHSKARLLFLESLSKFFDKNNINGCVAEGGVFQGEFAAEINRVFPKFKLYLFDTFSGFDARDANFDKKAGFSEFGEGHLKMTSEDMVISKLPYPEKCVICKGYFPETIIGINEIFCFVNLDFDLYQPTLAGLEYFIPRMVKGGVILVHDYFSDGYKGVEIAVRDYEAKSGKLKLLPIGDGISVAILC